MIGEMIEGLDQADINKKKYFYIIFTILVLAVSLFGLNGSLQNVDEVLFARTARESLEAMRYGRFPASAQTLWLYILLS